MIIPKVSVVMSVFNDEPYLRESVDSILNQTFRDFEFIIINDGSTDRTLDILSSYRDARIRLFDQENRGLTPSLNRGLSLARGVYIARMDGDDISLPERFVREVQFLDQHSDYGLVGTFCHQIDTQGRFIKTYTFQTSSSKIKEYQWQDCQFYHSSVMYRKKCVDEVGFYREQVGPAEDYDLWFRIAEHCEVANLPEYLHLLRINPEGISLKKRFDQIRYTLFVQELARQRQGKKDDGLHLLSPGEIDAILEKKLPKTKFNEDLVKANNYIFLAESNYVINDLSKAILNLKKYLVLKPTGARGLILLPKIIYKALFPFRATRKQ
jgi:glycosyltransferase involved in cell wall biosynthesis